jgi:hypothetical protein
MAFAAFRSAVSNPSVEVVIDGRQNRLRVGGKVLIAQQLAKAHRGAQFRG